MSMMSAIGSVIRSTVVSVKSALAELIGTALFVTVATGTAVGLSSLATDSSGGYDAGVHAIGTAMAFGLTITSLAYATAHTSGGQFNPAVTVGLVASGTIPALQGALNIGSQVIGAVAGSTIVYLMYPGGGELERSSLGANILPPGMSAGKAFLGEMVATFALVFVVLETACSSKSKENRMMAPVAIGYMVFVEHMLFVCSPHGGNGVLCVSLTLTRDCKDYDMHLFNMLQQSFQTLVSMMDIGFFVFSLLALVLFFCWISFLLAWCKLGWS